MDIKEKIESVIEKIKKDPSIKEQFEKDPVKAIEKVLGVPADVLMNMQTQYDLDTANIASRSNENETVEVIIPVRDRNLLKEIARKFGWACML